MGVLWSALVRAGGHSRPMGQKGPGGVREGWKIERQNSEREDKEGPGGWPVETPQPDRLPAVSAPGQLGLWDGQQEDSLCLL